MADGFVLEIPEMVGIPLAAKRTAQEATQAWPAGTVIVSADSHMIERDCWYDKFPKKLRDKAPRIEFKDGGYHFSLGQTPMLPMELAAGLCEAMECNPGLSNADARLKDLDIEGVEKELIFPQRLFGLYIMGHDETREEIFSIYNEDIAVRCAEGRGRLYPVMIPNFWDLSKSEASLQRIKELGGRAVMLPNKPGKNTAGEQIFYNDPKMDPLWAAIEKSGLPMCFHIGEAVPQALHGAAGTALIVQMQGFRQQWGMLTFGGVFDRFPGLKVVFVEAGLSWVASMLHDADMGYNSFPNAMKPELAHPPSWYWRNHCYATFMTDPVGLQVIERIGPETAMWSSDYPHQESTFGYTRSAIQAVFDSVPNVEDAQKIVGKTALDVFNMHEPYYIPVPEKPKRARKAKAAAEVAA
ncbi:amidohydrolase family protein [uncultured Phenylobacterium sp.]|uniref:amidohydrolase family protein n=1 Tax=uncultured Phenylobacterium sp. TaxID=349273 RepID=UPI0025F0709D|nr:amidohydrolase family protein [uncultured Phenylobacterium sp.]